MMWEHRVILARNYFANWLTGSNIRSMNTQLLQHPYTNKSTRAIITYQGAYAIRLEFIDGHVVSNREDIQYLLDISKPDHKISAKSLVM